MFDVLKLLNLLSQVTFGLMGIRGTALGEKRLLEFSKTGLKRKYKTEEYEVVGVLVQRIK